MNLFNNFFRSNRSFKSEIFETSNFRSDYDPWSMNLFKKRFDAYFFIDYSIFSKSEPLIIKLSQLQNNINCKHLKINNIKGKSKTIYNINLDKVIGENVVLKEKFKKDRFLFWKGENDQWSIISDEVKKIAIIAVDWQISEQIELFFSRLIIKPKEIFERLQSDQFEKIYKTAYNPSENLILGNKDNPIWVKYFFECKVPSFEDRLFQWRHFEKLYYSLIKLLAGFQTIDMWAYQTFEYEFEKNSIKKNDSKVAPLGGWQKFSYKNCKKVATKYLGKSEFSKVPPLHKSGAKAYVRFGYLWVYANLNKVKVKGQRSHFYFLMGNGETLEYNQYFNFLYKKSTISDDAINMFIDELKTYCFIKRIHRIEKPNKFATYDDNNGTSIEGIFGFKPDLKENTYIIGNEKQK